MSIIGLAVKKKKQVQTKHRVLHLPAVAGWAFEPVGVSLLLKVCAFVRLKAAISLSGLPMFAKPRERGWRIDNSQPTNTAE